MRLSIQIEQQSQDQSRQHGDPDDGDGGDENPPDAARSERSPTLHARRIQGGRARSVNA